MKRCDDCRYRNEPEYNKPCVVYRDDCGLYEKGVKRVRLIDADKLYPDTLIANKGVAISQSQIAKAPTVQAVPIDHTCPYYRIDDDGHGLCINHKDMHDNVLQEIRQEIETK